MTEKQQDNTLLKSFAEYQNRNRSLRVKSAYEQVPERNISEAINHRKNELENDDFAQNIKLKKWTLVVLFGFFAIETIVIFVIAFAQGYGSCIRGFHLDEWSFRLVIAATITQVATMLLVAVKHLFPRK